MALLLNAGDTVSRSYSYTQPSPLHPSQPQGTGERTGNLFSGDFSQFDNVGGTGNIYTYFYIPEDFTLTLVAKDTHTIPDNIFLGITKDGGQSTGGFTWAIPQRKNITEGDVFTVKSSTSGYHYVSMYRKITSVFNWILEHYYVMLNSGSTALPYEPYGYKIPISSANTTTTVHLGEVETTRKIAKIDLGTLNWSKTASGNFNAATTIPNIRTISNLSTGNAICDMFKEVTPNAVANEPYSFSSCLNTAGRPFINRAGFEELTAEEFKQAMSGVYMYYVLATEETAVVNEPLMRIGDYADTVSGISIPVTAGGDTLSVGTTVQPSEVTVNYKGWHPVADVHERDNGAWT